MKKIKEVFAFKTEDGKIFENFDLAQNHLDSLEENKKYQIAYEIIKPFC